MRWLRQLKPVTGYIDSPEDGRSFHALVRLEGWALARSGNIQLEINLDGVPVPARIKPKARPDVLQAYPWAARRGMVPGFTAEFDVQGLPYGPHEVTIWGISGRRRTQLALRTVRIVAGAEIPPPLLFVHIPKTAGTSLTAYLERQYPADRVLLHAENQVFQGSSPEEIRRLGEYDLLSAHLMFDTLERLVGVERHVKITVFREPKRQLRSHLAWIEQLGLPQRRLELAQMPEYIQAAVERLGRLGRAGFLETLTPVERRLLDNCQTRYLLPQDTTTLDESMLSTALAQLERIDLVGITERLDDFLLLLAQRMSWEPPEAAPHLNTSSGQGLQSDEGEDGLQAHFDRLTRLDQVVYAAARQRFEREFGEMQ